MSLLEKAFFPFPFAQTNHREGGMSMAQQHEPLPETHNPFERENINCNRNDAIDAGMGFVVSFGFFSTMFIIATVIQFINA